MLFDNVAVPATWGSTFANMMIVIYFLYIGGNSLEVGDMLFDNVPVPATWGSTFANMGIVDSYILFIHWGQ